MALLESGRDTTRAGRPGGNASGGGVSRGHVHLHVEIARSACRDAVGVAPDKPASLTLAGVA